MKTSKVLLDPRFLKTRINCLKISGKTNFWSPPREYVLPSLPNKTQLWNPLATSIIPLTMNILPKPWLAPVSCLDSCGSSDQNPTTWWERVKNLQKLKTGWEICLAFQHWSYCSCLSLAPIFHCVCPLFITSLLWSLSTVRKINTELMMITCSYCVGHQPCTGGAQQ